MQPVPDGAVCMLAMMLPFDPACRPIPVGKRDPRAGDKTERQACVRDAVNHLPGASNLPRRGAFHILPPPPRASADWGRQAQAPAVGEIGCRGPGCRASCSGSARCFDSGPKRSHGEKTNMANGCSAGSAEQVFYMKAPGVKCMTSSVKEKAETLSC